MAAAWHKPGVNRGLKIAKQTQPIPEAGTSEKGYLLYNSVAIYIRMKRTRKYLYSSALISP
jgi:hypothetical protein